jgi:hypothetical protein
MRKAEHAQRAQNRNAVLATLSLAAIMLLPDPDQLLLERRILMTKSAAADQTPATLRDKSTPGARDPKIAVEEEYQIARQRGTAQALELFIARHADDPLAEKARADLRRLSR